jgi:hypothetical protein
MTIRLYNRDNGVTRNFMFYAKSLIPRLGT